MPASLFEWCLEVGTRPVNDHLRYSITLRAGCALSRDEENLWLEHPWGRSLLGRPGTPGADTLHALSDGPAGVEEVAKLLTRGTAPAIGDLAAVSRRLWFLERAEFACELRVEADAEPLLTLTAVSPLARLLFADPGENAAGLAPAPGSRLFPRDGYFALESPQGLHRCILMHERALAVVAHASNLPGVEAGDAEIALAVRECLGAAGLMAVPTPDGRRPLAETHGADLMFHRLSRFGRHDGPFGATFQGRDFGPAPAALPEPYSDHVVDLPVPNLAAIDARDVTLTAAMENRRSTRQFQPAAISLHQLSEFLFRCVRVRGRSAPDESIGLLYEVTDRPVPSGGGMHDLELYVMAGGVAGLPPDAYHYDAERHALERLGVSPAGLSTLLAWPSRASGAAQPPAVLITLASRFSRVAWKYESIALATTLKNVGVLYEAMYLVATAMGLGCCALGSGDDLASERLLGLSTRQELPVGEFMLGVPLSE